MMKPIISFIVALWGSYTLCAQATILVTSIPSNTPSGDALYIAGDFQSWNPGSPTHQLHFEASTGNYWYTFPVGTGPVNFKFTRGSWSAVESDAAGNFIPNRSYTPVDGDTVYYQILGWEDLNGSGTNPSTAASNVEVVDEAFFMPQLNRSRRVWIYLPPDYPSSSHNYPVLYMHDGQNVFDQHTSFSGEWEVDETLNRLFNEGDPGVIVVAIDNGGGDRIAEYTPWSHPTYGGGDGAAYIDFIVDDLMPYINANYRTLSDRDHTGIMGSSLGGLISLYGGIKFQNTFSKVGSLSPAYWINPAVFDFASSVGKEQPMRVYQVMGSLEGASNIARMMQMEDTLRAAGFSDNEVRTIEVADGEHSEWFWAREFEDAYKWLFRTAPSFTTDLMPQHGIRLYPNPVQQGRLTVELELKAPQQVTIELIDSAGAFQSVLFADVLEAGEHHLPFELHRYGLSAGVYFCRIVKDGVVTVVRFGLIP